MYLLVLPVNLCSPLSLPLPHGLHTYLGSSCSPAHRLLSLLVCGSYSVLSLSDPRPISTVTPVFLDSVVTLPPRPLPGALLLSLFSFSPVFLSSSPLHLISDFSSTSSVPRLSSFFSCPSLFLLFLPILFRRLPAGTLHKQPHLCAQLCRPNYHHHGQERLRRPDLLHHLP